MRRYRWANTPPEKRKYLRKMPSPAEGQPKKLNHGWQDCTDWKRLKELRDEAGGQRSDFPISRFQISAFALGSPLWSQDFTAKLFCNVEFGLQPLPKLIRP
jgi:hypothetical protein